MKRINIISDAIDRAGLRFDAGKLGQRPARCITLTKKADRWRGEQLLREMAARHDYCPEFDKPAGGDR